MTASEFGIFVGLAQAVQSGNADAYIGALVDAGINRYWFSSNNLASIVQTAINARQAGKPVGFINLMIESDLEPSQQALWAKKWADALDKEPVEVVASMVKQLHRDAALRQVQEVIGELARYSKENPRDVLIWLPTAIQALRSVQQTGDRYDPRPSVIFATQRVPRVVARFTRFPTFNKMLGGGLWDGRLVVYGAPTGMGKSTFAYTMIAHAIVDHFKTVLFSRENTAAEATARILQIYGDFTKEEVEIGRGSSPERHQRLYTALREMDRYLSIYDRDSAALGAFQEIVHWEEPVLAVVDHLGLYGDTDVRGLRVMGKADTMGDLADHLRALARLEYCTILATAQFSADEQRTVINLHDLNPPKFYGSSRIAMAADYGYISARYWKARNTGWVKCKKDSVDGVLYDEEWLVGYHGATRSYYDLELAQTRSGQSSFPTD